MLREVGRSNLKLIKLIEDTITINEKYDGEVLVTELLRKILDEALIVETEITKLHAGIITPNWQLKVEKINKYQYQKNKRNSENE
jgi:hypothetical protein